MNNATLMSGNIQLDGSDYNSSFILNFSIISLLF